MEQQEEGRSTATVSGSTSRAGRIGRSVLALLALGGVIAVVAYYGSHVRIYVHGSTEPLRCS